MFTPKRKVAPLDWGALEAIVAWLNQPELNEGQEKVGQAVRLLQGMDQLWGHGGPALPDDTPEGRQRRELWEKFAKISRQLRPAPLLSLMMRPEQWRDFAELTATLNPLKFRVLPLGGHHIVDLAWVLAPEYGFLLLSQITKANLLGNLRQCKWKKCSRWFAATKNLQAFCCPDCQAAHWDDYRKSENGRAEMRAYMKRLRRKRKQESRTRRMKP